MMKRALLSVSDKTGLIELATQLHQLGIELLSTGGTATALVRAGIPVTNVSDVTGFRSALTAGSRHCIRKSMVGSWLSGTTRNTWQPLPAWVSSRLT